ncbi:uncharacterized protein N7459_006229 [Penicillium hispanicum]|uniref:uncharacterized protein n=1 Tax=Penicillium hispanicum TaxID=1080232 RepID=UPI00253FB9D8|nr:uncharacterized protein N7459_006229 [Penicillium hispanicum]KAJ5580244.1 hypothetical protein N7459_006229 [Penicillium hispanicum]
MPPKKRKARETGTPPPPPDEKKQKTEQDPEQERKSWMREILYGSPDDPTPRIKVDVKDLDLEKSYVSEWKPTRIVRPPKKRWQWFENEPLYDYSKAPKDWTCFDDDLDPDDIDGHILRCHERIQDNIMPSIFQHRLIEYEDERTRRREMMSKEPEGLSWESVQRLDHLKLIEEYYEDKDDTKQLANIRGVMQAYRSKRLAWTQELVTYWASGVQLCQPRPFDWDEFEAIYDDQMEKNASFWTEGIGSPEPSLMLTSITLNPTFNGFLTPVRLACRLPGYPWWCEFEFVYDTGATVMMLYAQDLTMMRGPYAPPAYPEARTPGAMGLGAAYGPGKVMRVVEIEVTILDSSRRRMTSWTRVTTAVRSGSVRGPRGGIRLDGPFLRRALFTGTAPDGLGRTVLSNVKSMPSIQARNLVTNPPPAWGYNGSFYINHYTGQPWAAPGILALPPPPTKGPQPKGPKAMPPRAPNAGL